MLGRFLKHWTGPIGCAFSDTELRLIQVSGTRGGQLKLKASCRQIESATADRAAWRDAAVKALERARANDGFVGNHVVATLPSDQVLYRRLRLPPMPASEVSSAVHWQIAKELSRPAQDLRTAHYEIGRDHGASPHHLEVVAVVADMAEINAHAEMIGKSGLTPIAIDTRPGALARCLSGPGCVEMPSGTRLIVDADLASITLIAARNGSPFLVHSDMKLLRQVAQRAVAGPAGNPDAGKAPHHPLHGDHLKSATLASSATAGSGTGLDVMDPSAGSYAIDLEHDVMLFAQYLADLEPGDAQPSLGCLLGGGPLENHLARKLGEASEIQFVMLNDMWSPALRCLTGQLPGHPTVDAWLPSLGLAFYGVEDNLNRAAA